MVFDGLFDSGVGNLPWICFWILPFFLILPNDSAAFFTLFLILESETTRDGTLEGFFKKVSSETVPEPLSSPPP